MTILRHPSLPEVEPVVRWIYRDRQTVHFVIADDDGERPQIIGPEHLDHDTAIRLWNDWLRPLVELQETLRYIERWVNHHGQKPGADPAAILSMIQHYPPIKAITLSYVDGKLPDTPDPWADLAAANARAERYMKAAIIGSNLAHERNCAIVRRGGTECNCSIAAIRDAINDQPEQPT